METDLRSFHLEVRKRKRDFRTEMLAIPPLSTLPISPFYISWRNGSINTEPEMGRGRDWRGGEHEDPPPPWRKGFGVSWQVVPAVLPELLGADDREAAGRAMEAMRTMKTIDIEGLERAFAGN